VFFILNYCDDNSVSTWTYSVYKQDVVGMTAPNPFVFRCFLWEFFYLRPLSQEQNQASNKGFLYSVSGSGVLRSFSNIRVSYWPVQYEDYLTLPFLCAIYRVADNETLVTYSWQYNYTVHVPYDEEIPADDSAGENSDSIAYFFESKKFRCGIVNLVYCLLINLYLECGCWNMYPD